MHQELDTGVPEFGLRSLPARILSGRRLYWLLAIVISPVPMIIAYNAFGFGCRCAYGAATADAFTLGAYVIWGRMLIALLFGERRGKAIIWLIMPLVLAVLVAFIAALVWPDAH